MAWYSSAALCHLIFARKSIALLVSLIKSVFVVIVVRLNVCRIIHTFVDKLVKGITSSESITVVFACERILLSPLYGLLLVNEVMSQIISWHLNLVATKLINAGRGTVFF